MLTPVMEIAAVEIATGKPLVAVAKTVKRNRSTLRRWEKDEAFKKAIRAAQQELKERILSRVASK